jgi:4-hydroxythreonine-4-phosphate dehydrogenase
MDSVTPSQVKMGEATASAGKGALAVLEACLQGIRAGDVDAICFAPLNKYALKLGGMRFEDELHYFAHFFGVQGYFCEFNTLGDLWTARVSSHVPMADILKYVTVDRISAAATLLHSTLLRAGLINPRIAIAALNPHAGDGGTCGREEIDIIEPAVRHLNDAGIQVQGPFPADTIFLKARDGLLDAVVTLYHDQGQIAIKLMGFQRGVTVQGGLPVPITTPAHGTAFDIAGKGIASVDATLQAFLLAARMTWAAAAE